ncbi:MAG: multicopper oxidase family protein [Anaerosolibacter sp.]|jgi:spore coat protein A|uniref:multicopper oxidase family protein n=1 Tax=Anaerosolibacter sp. TaxID=1872527 RepID=UPI0026181CCE|nr:multicopper oxidase [Anaerosolibacter sp.]MDF2548547.1 multicopper oxidase family protein [Anaerosolibacter sp.]
MSLTPFIDPLPIPKVLNPKERHKCFTYYEVTMKEFFHQFHLEMPTTKVWGYEQQLPGPTIEVDEGECVHVKWMNGLPDKHFLPIDHTLHGAGEHMPEVRTVVHLHGAEVEPDSDGYPEAWYTNGFQQCGPCFKQEVYKYPNDQRPTALWYHDHAVGITRLNVYAGLAGLYIIRNEQERLLNLPAGKYEIPLIIQDRSFNQDGSLFYPRTVNNPTPNLPDPSITPGVAGDFITVNGKVWPYLEVEQRKYRFRILNASNERFYRMKLDVCKEQPFIQIGSDGGLLEKPVFLDEITIAPSERIDVIIDFTDQPIDSSIIITNDARTPFDFGTPPDPQTTGRIMEFRVIKSTEPDPSVIPQFLGKIKKFQECEATRIRDITLDVTRDRYGRLKFLLSNHGFIDRITENPILNDIEIWRIINQGIAVHPIHIHLIQFQILDRIPFDADSFNATGQLRFTGEPELPAANERGWKDTVQATPGFVTRLIMRFGPYTGRYIYHCHILEHEDYDMMRPFEVVPPKCKYTPSGNCPKCSESFRCICE